jgi:hypothetical protein
LTWLLIATVVFVALVFVYLQATGVSPRTVTVLATVTFYAVSSAYILIKRRRFRQPDAPQPVTDWRRLVFLGVAGFAAWIALIFRFFRP